MGKLLWILLFVFCLVAVEGKKKTGKKPDDLEQPKENVNAAEDQPEEGEQELSEEEKENEPEQKEDSQNFDSSEESEDEGSAGEQDQFQCNLKFKRVGCYADKSKGNKPLKSFIMTDDDMGLSVKRGKLPSGGIFNTELPKFACKCANEAMNSGNAVFGIQNIAECWSGPDSSKYDKDGPSDDCVTFDFAPCDDSSEICAGKKHANFVYYVDAPEHTKTSEEMKKEMAEQAEKAKLKIQKEKLLKKKHQKKAKKANKKKAKKSKNE